MQGKENILDYDRATLIDVKFDIRGNHNKIFVEQDAFLRNVRFHIRGDHHRIVIGKGCRFSVGGMIWMEGNHGELIVGEETTLVEATLAVVEERSKIHIGKRCMFSTGIELRTSDSHAIIDKSSGERINPPKDIFIGDHVWVGARATLLKGVSIGKDSIVATGTVVTKPFGESTIVAGNPASIIRENVNWRRKR